MTATREPPPLVPAHAPEFVRTVTAEMMAGRGDALPVSALPVDGTYPSGTTAYEKRNISESGRGLGPRPLHPVRQLQLRLPAQRDPVQVLRPSPSWPARLRSSTPRRWTRSACRTPASRCRCTSRTAPAAGCVSRRARSSFPAPATKAINLGPAEPRLVTERDNIAFFESLPITDRSQVDFGTVRGTQFLDPLFEFSGAARAAAKRLTSNCCRSFSGTG